MFVDPNLLRAFAKQVEVAAAELDGIQLDATAAAAADGLPGSTTQWTMRQVGAHLGLEATDLIASVSSMGSAVRGVGDIYEVTDEALADRFETLF